MPCLLWTGPRFHMVALLALVLAAADPLPKRASAETPPAKELTNSLGMKFTAIPAGEFLMGALPTEITERKDQLIKRGGEDDNGDEIHKDEVAVVESEGPQHQVTIGSPFLLGTYEVTQAEFRAVMGFNPSSFSSTGARKKLMAGQNTERHPVDSVSWNDAVEFCRQLSGLAEEVAAGRSYRLPTEAEWEYACRAGTTTKFFWGDERGRMAADWTRNSKAVEGKRATTAPVGSLKPNPWGLYDIQGNVREWCADWYDPKAYAQGPVRDPAGPAMGAERVVRGGNAGFFPPAWRSASRRKLFPDAMIQLVGFRVVCEVRPVAATLPTAAVQPQVDAQLKALGLVRQGSLVVLAESAELARFITTLERMRVGCFNARREVEDAKKQLQLLSVAKAGVLQARLEAREMMRYSETWREHRNGVVSRNQAADALSLVAMSREDLERWLADAQADYEAALARFDSQCQTLREMHDRLQAKQKEFAADTAVQKAVAAASAGGKTAYRFDTSPTVTTSLKKLEREEIVVRQLREK